MSHDLVRILAQVAIFAMVPALPLLYWVYSDHFERPPDAQRFSSLLVIIVFLGLLIGVPAVAILAATALLGIGLAWLTARYTLTNLTYHRDLSPGRLFPGDIAELRIRIENRKILPLAWLSTFDPIHVGSVSAGRRLRESLLFSGGIELEERRATLVNRGAVGPYQSLTRTYQVTGIKRGVYSLGPARLESGDPFGLFTREETVPQHTEILVYPRVYRPDEIGLPFREAMGEVVPRRALIEDPTLLAGSREYVPGDPLNRVHWKATARTMELQVRVNDPSTTANLLIVLNLNTYQHLWHGVDLDRMEATISVAASLAIWGLERGYALGIRSNGITAGHEGTLRIPPSASLRQPALILDYLARLAFSGRYTAESVLLDEVRRLDARTSIVFITPVLTPALVTLLTSARVKGRVSVVYSGRAAPVVRGLTVHLVAPPDSHRAAS